MPFVQRDRGRELEYDSRRPERIETEINDDPVIYCYETGENGGGEKNVFQNTGNRIRAMISLCKRPSRRQRIICPFDVIKVG